MGTIKQYKLNMSSLGKSSWYAKKPEDPDLSRINNMKQEISGMYKDVCKKMAQHDQATTQYKQKQEQYFLKTFAVLMEKMSDELKLAQDRYMNIDMQIQKDKQVMRLQKEVYFFREQCLALKEEIRKLKQNNAKLNGLTHNLKQQKQQQYLLLLKRTKEKKALIGKIGRNSSEERPLTSLKQSTFSKDPFQQTITPGLSRTTNNLKCKHARSITKQLTRPGSDYESSTAKQYQTREKRAVKRNEMLEIWEDCIRSIRGNQEAMKFLAKQTKLKTLGHFFSIQRVIEYLTCKLFGVKCCENPKCKGNLAIQALDLDFDKLKNAVPNISRPLSRTTNIKPSKQFYPPYRKIRQNQPLVIQGKTNS